LAERDLRGFTCGACGFHFYLNTALAVVGVLLEPDGQLILVRRARDPAKGKLAMPGGFVDARESAESALRREVREELGVELRSIWYLASFPNDYRYQEVVYPVVDLFFTCEPDGRLITIHPEEVTEVCRVDPLTFDLEELAFPSMKLALKAYRNGVSGQRV
jgi:ADP-ribose pyrophosphatase YjhB (NUDIX family)